MRYLLLFALALLMSGPALAAPFVVSDPLDQRCTHFGILLDAVPKQVFPVVTEGANKIVKFDVAGVAIGTHTIRATCIARDAFGDQESPQSLPLTFARPPLVPPPAPVGIQLVPQ